MMSRLPRDQQDQHDQHAEPLSPASLPTRADVIVVGGGHAGCEAAAVAARMGAKTLLITMDASTIGAMSCNPAWGGLGKGHLLREIDAFYGVSPRVTDAATIMAQVLNRSRGPAVRGPRAQADRKLYLAGMQKALHETSNLTICAARVDALLTEEVSTGEFVVKGVVFGQGSSCLAAAVILTTGTFLRGRVYRGYLSTPGGRLASSPANDLDHALSRLGLPMGRFRTGTPPRLLRSSINFDGLEVQHGDANPEPMSRHVDAITNPQIPCYITNTTPATHDMIRRYWVHAAGAWCSGARPPRYCPSIEDKVRRFADKSQHQIFLEPEGLDSPLIYPNGLASSMPPRAQDAFLRTMPGLEHVRVTSYAYTIEYSYVDPRALHPTLECRHVRGLWLAGQINGTTGYEEAASLGLVAGINAALRAGHAGGSLGAQTSTQVFDRTQAYIGVLVDDLVTKGVNEPYRMLTCRAEYRLQLRADNADLRLSPRAVELGCLPDHALSRWQKFSNDMSEARRAVDEVGGLSGVDLKHWRDQIPAPRDGHRRSLWDVMGIYDLPDTVVGEVWPRFNSFSLRVREQLRIEALYAPYLEKQMRDIDVFKQDTGLSIPLDLDFRAIPGLSIEAQSILATHRPHTIGAAANVSGISPASVLTVLRFIRAKKGSNMLQSSRDLSR